MNTTINRRSIRFALKQYHESFTLTTVFNRQYPPSADGATLSSWLVAGNDFDAGTGHRGFLAFRQTG
ncbi:hypothetical protein DSL92_06870 [Billgrantia gudaonensis]|uniref:Uncharacterized protein n=1 Tax=Billgrantia gudaonensis TaxID=376427 RepID=A0A3S0NEM5_9GAMM|nr:hypothetical protein DSL92_06870 [Halomonas gudaonensis]